MIYLNVDGGQEFAVKYYRWALDQSDLEAGQNYPVLRAMGNTCRDAVELLETLPVAQRIEIGQVLVRRSHPGTLEILGEHLSPEEEGLLRVFDRQRWRIISRKDVLAEDAANRKLSRSALRKSVRRAVEALLGTDREVWGGTWTYQVEVGRWRVETDIEFRGGSAVMSYHHNIVTGQPRKVLADFVSAPQWLGVRGGTGDWSGLSDDDIPAAAEGLAFICRRFMEAIPSLLPE